MTRCLLAEHITAERQNYILRTNKAPTTLALGRWDARELARYIALHCPINTKGTKITARQWLKNSRSSGLYAWDAEVKLDGRIGRMPGALWWWPQ